ncbi:MAG: HAMP domain-containing protein, partial [Lachnospiraceae bacterium]|nr:HAMP domain-containing protein [Lachnospiraceae bacterium]
MKQRLKKIWQSLKIKQKIKVFTQMVFLLILLSIFLAVWTVKYSLLDFSAILKSNSIVSDFVQCMEEEAGLFEAYVKTGKKDTYEELERAIVSTQKAITQLPFDYEKIGEKRYAKTWSVLNMYQVYCERRSHVLGEGEKTAEYIADLYEVYDMQDYLQNYAKELMRDTLEDGVSLYAGKVKTIMEIPIVLIFFELLFFYCIRKLSELMNSSIVSPVMELAEASRRIAENDFFIDDIKAQSEDELGELVVAFNKMKYATGEYIMALEERRKALDLYNAEELEKIEISARLDSMELYLLKSQINTH